MSVNGLPEDEPGGGPLRIGVAVADISAGMYAAVAVLGALYHRAGTGEGQYIDVSLLDSQIAAMSIENLRYLLLGEVPQQIGNVSRNLVPNQIFQCADGLLTLNVGNDGQFRKLADGIGMPELAQDERFKTGAARRRNRESLLPVVERALAARPVREWVDKLAPAGVPCAPVNNIRQVFEDPQVVHRGMKVPIEHDALGEISLVGNPIRFSRTPVQYKTAPPVLGQHTRQVLQGLAGLTDSEIDDLSERGVI